MPNVAPDLLLQRLKSSFARSGDVACIQQPGCTNVWTCKSASVEADGAMR